jgi:hypothetical protein
VKKILKILPVMLITVISLFSQETDYDTALYNTEESLNIAKDTIIADTVISSIYLTADTTIPSEQNNSKQDITVQRKYNKHSPKLAATMSMIIPGAGQIYNEKYWKAPVVWAGLGISIYYIFNNDKKYNEYKNAYRDWIYTVRTYNDPTYVPDEPNTYSYLTLESLEAINLEYYLKNNSTYVTTFLYNNRASYKRDRDLSVIVTLGIYVLNIIDATVDAHLFDYDVGDNLSLRLEPKVSPVFTYNSSFGLSCKLRF